MNAQSTIESSNATSASSGDQDDPGSCPGFPARSATSNPEPNDTTSPSDELSEQVVLVDGCQAAMQGINIGWINTHLRAAVDHMDRRCARITVQLIDDAAMTMLHHAHCGINSTTDVLTFDATANDQAPIDVDIAVCVDQAARAAAGHHHSTDHELLLYALHGVLHCAGFDDHDDADYQAMHAEEDRLLALIGAGRVFNPIASNELEGRRR